MQNPKRGEVWLVDLGYVAKVRPCLVISVPVLPSDRALITLIPHTTSLRGSQFEIKTEMRFLRPGVFDVQNLITIPPVKLMRRLGNLPHDQIRAVEEMLRLWLGLTLAQSLSSRGDLEED